MTNDDKILKILDVISKNVATILKEQQAQRTDIRSLQRDVSYLRIDIETGKAELVTKLETVKLELKADIAKTLKTHAGRLTNLEEHTGISDPTKH